MHARANSLFANNRMSLKQPVRSAFVSNKKFRSSRDTGAFVSLSRKGSVKIDVTSIFWNLLGTLGADKTSKSQTETECYKASETVVTRNRTKCSLIWEIIEL